MPLSSQQTLNDHLARWNQFVLAYREARRLAAQTRADYEHQRASFKIRAKHAEEGLSAVLLDAMADADDGIYRAHLAYRLADAEVDALMQNLHWCRAQGEALRSEVTTERAEAQLYATDRESP